MESFGVYAIRSTVTGRIYVGQTGNFSVRLKQHNSGSVKSTKAAVPWVLVAWQNMPDQKSARWLEYRLKRSLGLRRRWLTQWGCLQDEQATRRRDDAMNAFQTAEKNLASMSDRMLAGVAAKYGRDSTEYEMAGGTRTSDRRRRPSKAAAAAAAGA